MRNQGPYQNVLPYLAMVSPAAALCQTRFLALQGSGGLKSSCLQVKL